MKHPYPLLAALLLCCAFSIKWDYPRPAASIKRGITFEAQIQIRGEWVTVYRGTNFTAPLQVRVRAIDANGLNSEWVTK